MSARVAREDLTKKVKLGPQGRERMPTCRCPRALRAERQPAQALGRECAVTLERRQEAGLWLEWNEEGTWPQAWGQHETAGFPLGWEALPPAHGLYCFDYIIHLRDTTTAF